MDKHTLDKLQFSHIRSSLADCCASTLGKTLARRLQPARQPHSISAWFEQVRQMDRAFDEVGVPPMGGVHDIRAHVRDAGTAAGLDAHELCRVSETLAATSNVSRWRASLPEQLEEVLAISERVGDFGPLSLQINKAIDERGHVRDEASSKLLSIRRSIDRLHDEIRKTYAQILKRPHILRMLQFPNTTMRGTRTVLPLKTEYRGRIKGIIHSSSDSGSTLFVEPSEVVEANNSIVSLRESERKEIARILGQLSFTVHENETGILQTMDALGVLDLVAAKVHYMRKRKAVCPDISEDRVLLLNQARHPVLIDLAAESGDDGKKVVPIDVRLGDDFDLLIITGPNTGGKTVTLKTIGLLALMTQCGIPIPAGAGSRVPIYGDIHIDVGDEQSIEQSLSTFSSHLSNILLTLRKANADSLVLLDELGSGTDPDEGAAIGRAIIDELRRLSCSAVVTTHLSALKSVAFTNERIDNASVEFDAKTLCPTFHLRIGEPGNSNALIIAQRLGMPRKMIKRARSYLSKRSKAINKVIAATLDSRRKAERARLEANQSMLEAEQRRVHYAHELEKLETERKTQYEWYEWVNTIRPGQEVFLRKFDRSAKVVRVQLHRQTALLTAGSVEMEVHLNELSPPPAEQE